VVLDNVQDDYHEKIYKYNKRVLVLNIHNHLDQYVNVIMNKNYEQLDLMMNLDLRIEFDEKILMLNQHDMNHFH
jgi:hypothetical protein